MTATISASLNLSSWQSVQPRVQTENKCADWRGLYTRWTHEQVIEFVQGRAVSPTVRTWVLQPVNVQYIPDNNLSDACFSLLSKIIFYEGRNFQGRHWECSSDCMDTFRHFNCCNSIRVSGGHWVAYEKPYYMGYQYILGPGEYSDYHTWMGFNNCVRSCQMFSPVSQSNRQIGLVVPHPHPTPTTHLVHQMLL